MRAGWGFIEWSFGMRWLESATFQAWFGVMPCSRPPELVTPVMEPSPNRSLVLNMNTPSRRRAKSGPNLPPSSAQGSVSTFTEPTAQPALPAAAAERHPALKLPTDTELLAGLIRVKTEPLQPFFDLPKPDIVNGLESELHKLAGHLTGSERVNLSRKLARWAAQLLATAVVVGGPEHHLPPRLSAKELVAN